MKLAALQREVKRLWTLACQHDAIPPASSFVVFSDDNPYVAAHNEAMGKLMKAQSAFRRFTKMA